MQLMSINSFASVIGGVQILIDIPLGNRLDPQLGRFFEESKSDAAEVTAWNSKLSQWGQKFLDKMSQEEKKLEVTRRDAGATAAREATRLSVTN